MYKGCLHSTAYVQQLGFAVQFQRNTAGRNKDAIPFKKGKHTGFAGQGAAAVRAQQYVEAVSFRTEVRHLPVAFRIQ